MLNIIQKPTKNFTAGRKAYSPQVIVLHIMVGSLIGTDDWFSRTASQVSANYGVGFGGEVHQYVKDEDTAWAQGNVNTPTFKLYKPGVNPNLYCLSIEHEGYDLSEAPVKQLNASVELIQALSTKYGIPIDRDHVIGHYEINRLDKPNCPSVDKKILDVIVARAKGNTPKSEILDKIEELKTMVEAL